jgi:outer membrane protein OmpA-like peptidoglycan-associated protein
MTRVLLLAVGAAVAGAAVLPAAAEAQILDRMKRRAQQQVERRVEEKAAQAVEKGLDTVECAATDRACIAKAKEEGKTVVAPGAKAADGAAPAGAAAAAPSAGKPGEGAWVNYDFMPGERPIFVEDFARDRVGDFPRRFGLVKGNVEVAQWNGARWLRATSWPTVVTITLPEALPERFTVEMDVVPGRANNFMEVLFADDATHRVRARYFGGGVTAGIGTDDASLAEGSTKAVALGAPFPLRIMVDGGYAKVYAGDTRVANVPNAQLGRSNVVTIELPGTDETPGFVGNVRIMAGGRDLYDALSAEGRVATQGIFFDTGSDVIRPESTPTLKEIGEMLAAHADLRLTIEGHTDNVGDAAANRALSERRAAAVKAYLVSKHGVSADRLQTAGHGDAKPAAPNATAEGRAQNRRVELVKM